MASFEDLTLTLAEGYPAYARYWAVREPLGAVLYLHGIQSHCGWYEHSAAALQQAGYAVLQPDRRGSGRNSVDRGHAASARQLVEDVRRAAEWLQHCSGRGALDLLGISWGGRLAIAALAADALLFRSLTLVSPGLFPRIDVSQSTKFRIGLAMLGQSRRTFDIPLNEPELFTARPEWIEFLRRDERALHRVSASFFLATRRMDAAIRHLPQAAPLPLHLLVGDCDRIIDVDRTVQYVRDLNWPKIRISHYPDTRHTLEFEAIREDYCRDVVEWLDEVSAE